jgi:hypothetical protein
LPRARLKSDLEFPIADVQIENLIAEISVTVLCVNGDDVRLHNL